MKINLTQAIQELISYDKKVTKVFTPTVETIYSLVAIVADETSSCGFSVQVKVEDTSTKTIGDLSYGNADFFLFDKDDKFYTTREEASLARAQMIAEQLSGADWLDDNSSDEGLSN